MIGKGLNIVFMGTPDFSVPALKRIIEDGNHSVVAVFSQPPRPSGRGHKITPSPVHLYAESQNIPVFTPLSLKKEDAQTHFASLKADIAVVAAYGLILPKAVLEAPRFGCLNIHASLLPRWRGAAPIQRSIWAGDSETGITIMQMDAGLDTGGMISKGSIPITNETTAQTLHDALSQMGGDMILKVLNEIAENGSVNAQAQDDSQSCYAKMLKREDGRIDWSQTASEIDRQVRALTPWPGTYTNIDGKVLKIQTVKLAESSHSNAIGTVLDKKGHIACGGGTVLKLDIVKPENSKAMDIVSAFNGGYIALQSVLQ